jgi:hypothetical protein
MSARALTGSFHVTSYVHTGSDGSEIKRAAPPCELERTKAQIRRLLGMGMIYSFLDQRLIYYHKARVVGALMVVLVSVTRAAEGLARIDWARRSCP